MKTTNKPKLLNRIKNIVISIGDLALYVIYINTVLQLKLPTTVIVILSYVLVISVAISGKAQLPK